MRGWRAWARPRGDSAARRLCVFLSSNRAAPAALNGSPLQSDHALPSTFFSLFPIKKIFVSIRAHSWFYYSPPFVYFVFFVVHPLLNGRAAAVRPK